MVTVKMIQMKELVKKIGIVRGGDNDDEGIMCEDCSQILYSAASLARHKEMIHGRETEKFICYDCGQILKTSKQLHNHQRKHETFVCEKCTKSFSMNNKQKHIKLGKGINVVAPSPMKRCDECDYETKYQSRI